MVYIEKYQSPLGKMTILTDDCALLGLWFDDQKYYMAEIDTNYVCRSTKLSEQIIIWLENYFKGENPMIDFQLKPAGSVFRQNVYKAMSEITYGSTSTYRKLAVKIGGEENSSMLARAVGGAVSHNPISIIVPCHRVIGSNGSLCGYAGGLDRKIALLKLERQL